MAVPGFIPVKETVVPGVAGISTVYRVPLGRLALTPGVARQILDFRRHVEEAVAAASGGKVSLWQAKRIRTAALSLAEAKRAQVKLAKGGLTEEQEMGWSDRVVRHEAACDKALESLGINKDRATPSSFFDTFYREQQQRQAEQLALLANGSQATATSKETSS